MKNAAAGVNGASLLQNVQDGSGGPDRVKREGFPAIRASLADRLEDAKLVFLGICMLCPEIKAHLSDPWRAADGLGSIVCVGGFVHKPWVEASRDANIRAFGKKRTCLLIFLWRDRAAERGYAELLRLLRSFLRILKPVEVRMGVKEA